MSELYPHECCRCGMCCISTPCSIAMNSISEARKGKRCPALDIDDNGVATCKLIEQFAGNLEIFGVGKGCCIKASILICGEKEMRDFAGLNPATKRKAVKNAIIINKGGGG